MQRPNGEPGIVAWGIAFISVALPWLGAGLLLVGGYKLSYGERDGWWWLGAGAGMMVADVLIDLVWAHPSISRSDEPDLNRPSEQLIGRVLVVAEAIEGGRGKLRVGDTFWPAEGPDMPVGSEVRVVATRATVLIVERI